MLNCGGTAVLDRYKNAQQGGDPLQYHTAPDFPLWVKSRRERRLIEEPCVSFLKNASARRIKPSATFVLEIGLAETSSCA